MGCGTLTDLSDDHYNAGRSIREKIGDPNVRYYMSNDAIYHDIDPNRNPNRSSYKNFMSRQYLSFPRANIIATRPPPNKEPVQNKSIIQNQTLMNNPANIQPQNYTQSNYASISNPINPNTSLNNQITTNQIQNNIPSINPSLNKPYINNPVPNTSIITNPISNTPIVNNPIPNNNVINNNINTNVPTSSNIIINNQSLNNNAIINGAINNQNINLQQSPISSPLEKPAKEINLFGK